MLLISCYILYAFHLHILVIYFYLSYNVLYNRILNNLMYFYHIFLYSYYSSIHIIYSLIIYVFNIYSTIHLYVFTIHSTIHL